MAAFRRLFRLSGREPRVEEDLAQEFEAHLAHKADALIREGYSPAAARREAERRFGSPERFARECRAIDLAERRERRRRERVRDALHDIGVALRGLRRAPGFALTAVLVLAAGIGLTATVFTVLRGVVLRPLPYPHPGRLVAIYSSNPQAGWPTFSVSPTDFYDWSRDARSFSDLVAWSAENAAATGVGAPERISLVYVTQGFFPVTGVTPLLGRGFAPAEFVPGGPRVTLLSYDAWVTRFGRDPAVIGKSWTLDDQRYEIIAVLPAGFAFPLPATAAWVPFQTPADVASERGAHYVQVVGRLAEGATLAGARSELVTLAARIAREFPRSSAGWTVVLRPLHEDLVGDVRPTLILLMTGAGLLLVLACANVANLVLVRAIGRSGEAAVRSALGAGRGRLLWHGASEVVVLVGTAALLALPIAAAGAGLIRRFAPPEVPRLDAVRLDLPVLLFSLGVTAVVALLVSVAPARRLARSDLRGGLATAGGRNLGTRRGLHRWLVALETALALALLAVAGVLVKSMQRLSQVEPGVDPGATLVADLALPESGYPTGDAVVRFQNDLLGRLHAVSGVESAAFVFGLPLSGFSWSGSFTIDSVAVPDGVSQSAQVRIVGPEYFATQRIVRLTGRSFGPDDRRGGPPVLVINAAAARKFWPEGRALGHFLRFGVRPGPDRPEGTIIGIVGDVHDRGLAEDPWPTVYASTDQVSVDGLTLAIRTRGSPEALVPELRRLVAALDPELPLSHVTTMDAVARAATATQRFRTWLMGFFAALATALAGIGVYGVISHIVAQRTREMGLRRALGASDRQVVAQVVRGGMRDALIGAAAGLLLAAVITRRLTALLFEVRPGDPLVLVLSTTGFLGIALLACWVPARRASRADPVAVLRGQ